MADTSGTDDTDRLIRERAYAIWEREGRPHGRERDHWHAAAVEIAGERRSKPAERASKRPGAESAERVLAKGVGAKDERPKVTTLKKAEPLPAAKKPAAPRRPASR